MKVKVERGGIYHGACGTSRYVNVYFYGISKKSGRKTWASYQLRFSDHGCGARENTEFYKLSDNNFKTILNSVKRQAIEFKKESI